MVIVSHHGNCSHGHSLSYHDAHGGDHALPHHESRTNVSDRVLPPIELCDTDLRRIPLFCSHTRSEAQTGTNIKACSDFSKSENFLQKGSSHDYQTSIWNQLFQSPDRQLCMDRQSKDSWSVQFFCNSFAVLDQGRFLWGGIFIVTSAQYSGQPPLATPHSRTQIVTQRTRKRTSVDTKWSGWTPRSWSKKSQERQEAPDWLERFAGFQKISVTQLLIVHMMRSPCSAFSSIYSLSLEFLSWFDSRLLCKVSTSCPIMKPLDTRTPTQSFALMDVCQEDFTNIDNWGIFCRQL